MKKEKHNFGFEDISDYEKSPDYGKRCPTKGCKYLKGHFPRSHSFTDKKRWDKMMSKNMAVHPLNRKEVMI